MPLNMKHFMHLIISLGLISRAQSWDTEELEIFDLVEEVNQNFYEFMGLEQEATGKDIKRAFRNLSIYLHPDKSDAEDANIKFRNLVSVYEVLKDHSKREKYNKVLRDGLPNWKSAVYYYRRVRKMGFAESAVILFVIITIGQYLVAWGVYIEKKYTAEQVLFSKLKKWQRKNKTNMEMDDILKQIPSPSIYNTLPFQIPMALWNTPKTVKSFFESIYEYKKQEMEKKKLEVEEFERQKQIEEEFAKEREAKKEKRETIRKRRQAQKAPEKTDEELAGYSQLKIKELTEDDIVKPIKSSKVSVAGGFWSDEDLIELVRLVKKYPGGSVHRWEMIAETMGRTVTEVTFMAAKLKENGYRTPGQTESVAESIIQDSAETRRVKTKKVPNPILVAEVNWTQDQQKALEAAIVKYRKTASGDRWQKIANSVPEKTKEECLDRYKYLVELVKAQKQNRTNKDDNNFPDETMHEDGNVENEMCIETMDTLVTEVNIVSPESIANDIEQGLSESTGGKPRNKRKERKKRQQFSSDEEYSES